MKFNKTFLTVALIAGSLTLAACNDKDKEKAAAPAAQAQTAPAQQTQPASQPAPQAITADSAMDAFNQAVKINVDGRRIVQDDQGVQGVAFAYRIENLSDKPIAALHWVSLYRANGQNLYAQNFPLTFETPIAAKGSEVVTGTMFAPAIPEANRALAFNPETPFETLIGAYQVTFTDGTAIVVATPNGQN